MVGAKSDRANRIAVLGAAFKPNSDDVRDAPALAAAASPVKAGADVHVYDPQGTAWAEFRNADPQVLEALLAGKRVIDGKSCLDMTLWARAGREYRGMGRPAPAL